jgi:hypothetical protein
MEVLLDLGSEGLGVDNLYRIFRALTPETMTTQEVMATPMSLYLDSIRRDVWATMGEPERPPLGPLGEIHNGGLATGPRHYRIAADGPARECERRERDAEALNAKAQALWEEKARAEAEEWRNRLEAERSTEGKTDDA